jgi:hypothetical protein
MKDKNSKIENIENAKDAVHRVLLLDISYDSDNKKEAATTAPGL